MHARSTDRRSNPGRPRLSRERVVDAATALADEKGVHGITMRAIASRLGVEAMSLYNHVPGRESILDEMVDAVFREIDLPNPSIDWRPAIRDRAVSARSALRRHPWAVGLLDSRSKPGPATLRHHDAVLGALRRGGFSVAMSAHAVSMIDSYLYGFVLQESSLPFASTTEVGAVADNISSELPVDTYPHLIEMISEYARVHDYDFSAEFEFGLDHILDALHPDEA